jgi:nitrous oxidase accessory protein NosD
MTVATVRRSPEAVTARRGAFVLAAVLLAASAVGCGGSSSSSGPRTIRVPEDQRTIQRAVDRAHAGDLVLVGAGQYHESVTVTVPAIVIRGVDRNATVIDGRFTLDNGFRVTADGVAIENLTVRNFNVNGVLFTGPDKPLIGYRASYVTAYNNGLYGFYAFSARGGAFEHSYASGHPDSGFYVGQCRPCDAVVRDVIADHNATGYEGTNASTNVFVVNSTFSHNRVGIATGSKDLELLAPQQDATIAANRVVDNDDAGAPASGEGTFGYGIVVTGGIDDVVTENRVTGHSSGGILIAGYGRFAPQGNRVEANVLADNRVDLAYVVGSDANGATGNCFAGNTFATSTPLAIELTVPCSGAGSGAPSSLIAVVEAPVAPDFRSVPAPPSQPDMPNASTAPASPAVDVDVHVDVSALDLPPG